MKKIFATLFAFAAIASMTMLTSCGGAPSNEEIKKIVDRYDEGGGSNELNDKDYDMLISYLEAAVNEALPLAKEMKKADENDDYDKVKELNKKNEQLEEKYSELPGVIRIFNDVDEHEMGDTRYAKIEKLRDKSKNEGLTPGF